jgi:hypothetical protein
VAAGVGCSACIPAHGLRRLSWLADDGPGSGVTPTVSALGRLPTVADGCETGRMVTTIVHLMRHGEVHNPAGVLYGRLPDYHLSERGRAMATRSPTT